MAAITMHHGYYNNDGKMRPVPLLAKRCLILKEDKTSVSSLSSRDLAHIWGGGYERIRKPKNQICLLEPLLTDAGGICSMRTVGWFFSSSFYVLLLPLHTLKKIMSPPSILQTDLLNTQKQDKGEMESDSCQSIETGSKNGSFLTDPRHSPKPFHTFVFLSVYLPCTDRLFVLHKDKKK